MSEIILTPIMTSNTEPSGKCNASSQLATNCEAFQAFRQTNSTDPSGYYNWIAAGNVGNWISYEFDTPKKVTKLIVWNMNTSVPRAVKTFIFQGSNDGQNFTDIKTCSIGSSEGGYKSTYAISSEAYSIYRLYITEVYDSDYTAFGRIDLIGDQTHLKSAGSPEAIRDWFNASLYNKEEIDNLFIQNNQTGLIPYDLTIQGYEPEQYVKLVGQTSGKTYNLCLAALMGDSMGKAKIYDPVINSDVLNSITGKIFVKGNIAFCNMNSNYKTTGSSNKHIFTIPEEIRPCSFVTFETGDGAHTNTCGYGYIDPTDGKVYTSNEHNNYQYMSMCWLIPDETVNFKSQDSSVESMLGGVIGIIGKDMAYISTKVHLGSHDTGWKTPLLELPESIAPVNNYDFIPVVRMLSAVNGNDNSFRDAHYELSNDKCCVNVFVYNGDYDFWVTGYWKFK